MSSEKLRMEQTSSQNVAAQGSSGYYYGFYFIPGVIDVTFNLQP